MQCKQRERSCHTRMTRLTVFSWASHIGQLPLPHHHLRRKRIILCCVIKTPPATPCLELPFSIYFILAVFICAWGANLPDTLEEPDEPRYGCTVGVHCATDLAECCGKYDSYSDMYSAKFFFTLGNKTLQCPSPGV